MWKQTRNAYPLHPASENTFKISIDIQYVNTTSETKLDIQYVKHVSKQTLDIQQVKRASKAKFDIQHVKQFQSADPLHPRSVTQIQQQGFTSNMWTLSKTKFDLKYVKTVSKQKCYNQYVSNVLKTKTYHPICEIFKNKTLISNMWNSFKHVSHCFKTVSETIQTCLKHVSNRSNQVYTMFQNNFKTVSKPFQTTFSFG